MKRVITLIIALLLWAGSSWGTIITIGTGTSSQRQPFGMYWGYERSASIYTQAEITTFGTITTIGWYVGTAQNTNCPTKIYLNTTSATTLTAQTWATMISGATLVYDVTRNYTPTGWLTIDITDYTYSIDNLLVLCETNYGGGGTTSYPYFQYSTATSQHEIWYADNAPPTGSGSVGSLRPNIQFDIGALSGPLNPTAFTATAVSASQINLSWALNANGNAVMLVWNSSNTFGTPADGTPYGVGATIPGGGTVLQNNTGTSYNHSPLTSNTPYFYKAYSVASGNTYSSGASASATTLCDVYPQITEDFEPTAFPPACWSLFSGSGNWARTTLASGYGSGLASAFANFFLISGSTPFELVSPEFNATGAVLSFDHAYATYTTENDQLLIFYSTNGGSSYTLLITLDGGVAGPLNTGGATLSSYTPTASQWATKSYSLPAGTNKVKFHAISAFGNNLFLDNIFIGAPPSVDLRFNKFYQSTGLPIPLNAGTGSNLVVKNKMVSGERQDYLTTLPSDVIGLPESDEIYTTVVPDKARSTYSIMLADIQVTAEIENIGLDPASYDLSWEVDGISQTPYIGPTVAPGGIHVASLLYPSPPARGTFLATGAITVIDDANPGNNNNEFRLRVYPDVYGRTIYDRGDNDVDTYIGWGDATIAMKAGVRYTAAGYIKPVGVDFICRTETVPAGTYTVEVRAAGTTTQAPGAVLYSIQYINPVFFSAGGDYMHFAFDENLVPTIAPGSDYWITIEAPLGILFPGGAHNDGFTPGRSFFYVASTDSWSPLIITTERAWIMRSVHVQGDIPACPPPPAPTVSNMTETTALVNLPGGYAIDSFFDIYYDISPATPPSGGTTIYGVPGGVTTPTYTLTDLSPGTTYDLFLREDCGFTASPTIDFFWMGMTGPGDLDPALSGGSFDEEEGETGDWYPYVNAPGSIDWWNIWFYNGPFVQENMKKIRMGFWVQKINPSTEFPSEIYFVVNWSTPAWDNPPHATFPSPMEEEFIRRSSLNYTEVTATGTGYQWIEFSYVISDYNPSWVSVDIWGRNIRIPQEDPGGLILSPSSLLFNYWIPNMGMPGGIIVHECLPKGDGNTTSQWTGPVQFITSASAGCDPPSNPITSGITETEATLKWDTPPIEPESFFDVYFDPGSDPFDGTLYTTLTSTLTVSGLEPGTDYSWAVRTHCKEFNDPDVDGFYIQLLDNGELNPIGDNGGTADEPWKGEDGIWRRYVNAPGQPEIDWWNIWFYNQPYDANRMKKIRMGFWIQNLNPGSPEQVNYVINWSTPGWTGSGYPGPGDEAYIMRSLTNTITLELGEPLQWIELYYEIKDYNPEWVSVDIWGKNIIIPLLVNEMLPPTSLLDDYWHPGMPGGIIVHECLPKPDGNTSSWVGPQVFITDCDIRIPSYTEDFANYDGTAPPPPCWQEADAGDLATGPSELGSSSWANDQFGNTGNNNCAKVNMYSNTMRDWLISRHFNLSAGGHRVVFDIALTEWNQTSPTTMGSDDQMIFLISSDGGTTWTPLQTWNTGSTISNTGETVIIDISAYNQSDVLFAFWANEGTVDDLNDYDFFVDNFKVEALFVWDGSEDQNWNNPNNWARGAIPDASSTVIIPPPPLNYFPVLPNSGVYKCFSITVGAGATVTIPPNGKLEVMNP